MISEKLKSIMEIKTTEEFVTQKDIFCILCFEHGIKKYGSYGLPDKSDRYCRPHSSSYMVNMKFYTNGKFKNESRCCKICLEHGIKKYGSYRLPDKSDMYCRPHALPGMTNGRSGAKHKLITDIFDEIEQLDMAIYIPNLSKKLIDLKRNDIKKFKRKGDIKKDDIYDLLIKQDYNCYICNEKVLLSGEQYCYYKYSIDRIDNHKPHDKNNCLISCYFCNCIEYQINKCTIKENAIYKICGKGCHDIKKEFNITYKDIINRMKKYGISDDILCHSKYYTYDSDTCRTLNFKYYYDERCKCNAIYEHNKFISQIMSLCTEIKKNSKEERLKKYINEFYTRNISIINDLQLDDWFNYIDKVNIEPNIDHKCRGLSKVYKIYSKILDDKIIALWIDESNGYCKLCESRNMLAISNKYIINNIIFVRFPIKGNKLLNSIQHKEKITYIKSIILYISQQKPISKTLIIDLNVNDINLIGLKELKT